jgi:hypothetical protein
VIVDHEDRPPGMRGHVIGGKHASGFQQQARGRGLGGEQAECRGGKNTEH